MKNGSKTPGWMNRATHVASDEHDWHVDYGYEDEKASGKLREDLVNG